MANKKIQDRQNIKLLNYGTSSFSVSTGKREFLFEGAKDGVPIAYYFAWEDIEAINTRSSAIKTGALSFSPEDREEGYTALKLYDWKTTIIFDETIADIILNPTIENLERILNIRDVHTIERFRGKMLSHINSGHGVDSRFIDVVNGRFKEINSGITKSMLVLKPNVNYAGLNAEDFSNLKNKNESMEKEIAELKLMMAELMKTPKKDTKKNTTLNN